MKPGVDRKSVFIAPVFLLIFYSVAVWRFLATGNAFYLWNFGYLGTALAAGIFLSGALPKSKARWGRCVTQFLVGTYLFVYVGIWGKENMQIEGFWFSLSLGIFAGATLHYFIAKIAGTAVFNRGWCGWACWTAMVLDLLPWTRPKKAVHRQWARLRYVHFFAVLAGIALVIAVTGVGGQASRNGAAGLYWFLAGNLCYYAAGFLLAFFLKDNRAFCKYACPIPVFQKAGAAFALMRMEIDGRACTGCGRCESHCPMQVKLLDYKNRGQRVLSTECILCQTCAGACPKDAIRMTFRPGRLAAQGTGQRE